MKITHIQQIKKRILSLALATIMLAVPTIQMLAAYADTAVKTSNYVISDMSKAKSALESLAGSQPINACIYLKDTYTMREKADQYSASVAALGSGQTVNIVSVDEDEGRNIWYKVKCVTGGGTFTGYVEREFVACADSRFVSWDDTYVTTKNREAVSKTTDTSDIEAFPEEYRDALYSLKKSHPDWIFVKFNTGLEWNSAVKAEGSGDRSLVQTRNNPSSYIKAPYGDGVWSYASDAIIAYYMDPRNFLDETQIFQFELLGYNSKYHSQNSVQKILDGTFMSGNVEGTSTSYASAFMTYGSQYSISPILQAARVYSEQGSKGSTLISGSYPGYEGLYNYYNIGASGATQSAIITSGLTYAREHGWISRMAALEGGAKFLSSYYISRGQDTLYFQKWNVSSTYYSAYSHQYMQDISAAYKNASSTYKSYNSAGLLKGTPFVFRIPVYNKMPSGKQTKPGSTDKLTINIDVVENLPVGQSAVIIPYINGGTSTAYEYTYSSSDKSVATVDSNGVITGVKPGNAKITVKAGSLSTVTCDVNVIKADIAIDDVERPEIKVTYSPDQKLGDIELPDNFAWTDPSTVPTVTNEGYTVTYSPDESKYNSIMMTLEVQVDKAKVAASDLDVPSDLTIEAGVELASVALPMYYAWKADPMTMLSKAGVYKYKAAYCVDTENYEVTEDIEIPVVVTCSTHKWSEWSEPSGGKMTRTCSVCDETETLEVSEQVDDKDCTVDGHEMVDGVCTRCGYEEPVIQEHIHQYSVSAETAATCTQTGEKTFTCSCGDSYTEEAKAIGHNYVGGVCARCGNRLTPTAAVTPVPSTAAAKPTSIPTAAAKPTATPTATPTVAPKPTTAPTVAPTPTAVPTAAPVPTATPVPTKAPVATPTKAPEPTKALPQITSIITQPPAAPTAAPTKAPEPTKALPQITELVKAPIEAASPTAPAIADKPDSASAPEPPAAVAASEAPIAEPPAAPAAIANTTTDTPAKTTETSADAPEPTEAPETDVPETTSVTEVTPEVDTDSVTEDKPQKAKAVIELVDTTTLTADNLVGLVGDNSNIEVVVGDGVVWDIDLTGVDLSTVNIDMNVTVGEANIPEESIKKLKSDDCVLMTLAHDGPFGFDAVLNIEVGTEHDGKYANLYYYNPDTDKFELVDSVLITVDGNAAFNMKHASEYAITFSDKQQMVKNAPNVLLIILLVIIVLGGMGALGFVVYRVKFVDDGEEGFFDSED